MEFKDLVQRTMAIRHQYADAEKGQYGRAWTNEEIALGLVGDIGDLMKLIMAHNGIRHIPDARKKLEHELADCLWSVMVLSHQYEIDLEGAFLQTMNELETHIATQRGTS